MNIKFNPKERQYQAHKEAIDKLLSESITQTDPKAIATLEKELSTYIGTEEIIVCNTQFNAFILLFMVLELKAGDEIITSPLSSGIAVQAALFMGAKVIFVDVLEQDFTLDIEQVEDAITERTKLLIPVSNFGNCADMEALNTIALQHNLCVIEDASESFGASRSGQKSLHLSKLSTTSFHPDMPLNGFGNGAALYIEDPELCQKARAFRSQGKDGMHYVSLGIEACMDQIQAKVVTHRLQSVDEEIKQRQKFTQTLTQAFTSVNIPTPHLNTESNFAYYPLLVSNLDTVVQVLKAQGVETKRAFIQPLHLHSAFSFMDYQTGDFPISEKIAASLLLLPLYAELTTDEVQSITQKVIELLK